MVDKVRLPGGYFCHFVSFQNRVRLPGGYDFLLICGVFCRLQKHKCVPLEDLAAEFKLRTQVISLHFLLE